MSCVKHDGGSTADEIDKQLVTDLTSWHLPEKHFVALITVTASNMNLLGKLMEARFPDTKHQYCTDHNLQLRVLKVYTGDIMSHLGDSGTKGVRLNILLLPCRGHMI